MPAGINTARPGGIIHDVQSPVTVIAPLEAIRHNFAHIHLHQFEQYDLWFLELAILVCFSVAALLCLRATSAPGHERLAFILYLVEICVVTPSTPPKWSTWLCV